MRIVNSVEEVVNWQAVSDLFAEVGWGNRACAEINSAFKKSTYVIFIYDQDQLIAFGRTIDDGRYYATLVDIVVKPKRQKTGLGRFVVNHLKEQLKNYRFITLTAAPGMDQFYLKLGWQRQTTALIWPVSEMQRNQNTIPLV